MAWTLYHLSHWSISTQVDPYVWRPDGVRMPGWPLHKFGDLRDIPFLGPDGGLPWTEWNTAFGSAPDETNKYDRMSRSFALAWEIWDRLPNDPSIHKDVRECYQALPDGQAKELVRIALTLRSGTPESVGWCTCITGFKFAQFLASEYYCVDKDDLHEALRWLDRTFGSHEVTTGEQGVVSQALEWYALKSRRVPLDELFLDEECTRSIDKLSPGVCQKEVARGVKIYEKLDGSTRCYECTAGLRTSNGYTPTEMVVLPVPGRDVGIASPLNAPEHHFTERLSPFGVRSCSIWPDNRNAFEELRRLMGAEAYKPSTSFFIVVRHIISGQAGRRGVVIFNKDGVAFASVTGARDLYAFDYPLHLISNECFDRVRATRDGAPHSRLDGGGPGYQQVTYPFDWLNARGTAKGGLKHWLVPRKYTPHLVMLRVALEATGATIPVGFPEVPSSVRTKLSEDKTLAYCSFWSKYVEGKCGVLEDFRPTLYLGAPTPREVSHRRANTRSCVLS